MPALPYRDEPARDALRAAGPIPPLPFWTAAIVVTLGLIVSRRPDGISNAQFWAEDGRIWYAQAYNEGALRALLLPAGGYLQSFSRLIAGLSLAVDLRHAPLLFYVAAVLVQALPPLYLLSSRYAALMPDLRVRSLAALLVIGAPNGFEIQSNVTNTQTHLALLSLLIVLAAPPRGLAGAVFDAFFLILGGLSGPTCILLLPIAMLVWRHEPSRWRAAVVLLVLLPASVQLVTYLSTGGEGRVALPLGASVAGLLRIVGAQIFIAGTMSAKVYTALVRYGGSWTSTGTLLIGLGGLLYVAGTLWRTQSVALRLFCLFGALALAAGLASPAIVDVPRWQALLTPNAGIRYYAPPILALLALLLWSACADPSPRFQRLSRLALAAVLLVGMPLDWRVAPRIDFDFLRHARRFDAAPPGTKVRIPIPPGWRMKLYKH
jgi:hypothetical protein